MSIDQIVTLDITQLNILKVTNISKGSWGSYTANWFYNYRKGTTLSVIPIKVQFVKL